MRPHAVHETSAAFVGQEIITSSFLELKCINSVRELIIHRGRISHLHDVLYRGTRHFTYITGCFSNGEYHITHGSKKPWVQYLYRQKITTNKRQQLFVVNQCHGVYTQVC